MCFTYCKHGKRHLTLNTGTGKVMCDSHKYYGYEIEHYIPYDA